MLSSQNFESETAAFFLHVIMSAGMEKFMIPSICEQNNVQISLQTCKRALGVVLKVGLPSLFFRGGDGEDSFKKDGAWGRRHDLLANYITVYTY